MYAVDNKVSSCQNPDFVVLAFSGAKKLDNTLDNLLLFVDTKYEDGPVAQLVRAVDS